MALAEGWYLMSTAELEAVLTGARGGSPPATRDLIRLSTPDALAYRDAGNLPDEQGRTLRLILHVSSRADIAQLDEKRLRFEPDYHDAPTWRRRGSKPINVVPLRTNDIESFDPRAAGEAWWDDAEMRVLEAEWRQTGAAAGLRVPAEYRSFVYKTLVSLRKAGREITVPAVVASLRRWLSDADVERIERALVRENPPSG